MGSYQLNWVYCCGGWVALGHRPGKRLRKQLDSERCTLVVNLLSENESRCRSSHSRIRVPMQSADPPNRSRDAEICRAFSTMKRELENGGKIYIHCSAGLHRTGMFGYAFFRFLEFNKIEAFALVEEMRKLTAIELTEIRRAWGDQFAIQWQPPVVHLK